MFDKDKDKDKDKLAPKVGHGHHGPPAADCPPEDPPPVVVPQLTDLQLGWWATYNAIAGGMWANAAYAAIGRDYIHSQANLATIVAHGEYPPDETPPP